MTIEHNTRFGQRLLMVVFGGFCWLCSMAVYADTMPAEQAGYTLVFDNFNPTEIQQIEQYLVMFSGYQRHQAIFSSMTRIEWWYQSSIASGKLNRNLTKLLDHLGLLGIVQFSAATYTIEKVTLPVPRSGL